MLRNPATAGLKQTLHTDLPPGFIHGNVVQLLQVSKHAKGEQKCFYRIKKN